METRQSSLPRILSRMIKRLADFASEDELYQILAEVLYELVPQSIVLINSYDGISRLFQLRAIYRDGIDMRTISAFMGTNPIGMSWPLNDEIRSILIESKLTKLNAGIYDLGAGMIQPGVCSALGKRLNIADVYIIGFTSENVLLGSACFLLQGRDVSLDSEQINSLINLISKFLHLRIREFSGCSHS